MECPPSRRWEGHSILSHRFCVTSEGFKNIGKTHSASAFLSQLLAALLEAIAGIINAVIAVGKALVDSLLGVIKEPVDEPEEPETGS
jgi:hypothetical protein